MDEGRREDLGALMARVFPRLLELEAPILAEEDLSMWEYAIVCELAALPGGEGVWQADLARRVRRDPTRLGGHMDDLEDKGLIRRERGSDQRRRLVLLTPAGLAAQQRAQSAIHAAEDEILAAVFTRPAADRFRRDLARLALHCVPD